VDKLEQELDDLRVCTCTHEAVPSDDRGVPQSGAVGVSDMVRGRDTVRQFDMSPATHLEHATVGA
jgi:hypothetical protein